MKKNITVVVTTATKLTQKQEKLLKSSLRKKLGSDFKLRKSLIQTLLVVLN